ncbi:MAG: hypothetical protein IKC31_01935 [Clostridia bacterium]|nr:hypothetical protein [Clostridia bacterium]
MERENLSYLHNGQTDEKRRRLQKQLLDDQKAVLSVCRSLTEEALHDLDSDGRLQTERQRAIEAMECSIRILRICTEQIPQPLGFFVSLEDKRATVARVTRLLLDLEEQFAVLRSVSVFLSCREGTLGAHLGLFLQAEEEVSAVLSLVEEDDAPAYRRLLEALKEGKQEFLHSSEAWRSARLSLSALCGRALPAFLQGMQVSADFDGAGAGCSIVAVRNLLGELQHHLERTQREWNTLAVTQGDTEV